MIYFIFSAIYMICLSSFVGFLLSKDNDYYSKSHHTLFDEICNAIHEIPIFTIISLITITSILWPFVVGIVIILLISYGIVVLTRKICERKNKKENDNEY